MSSSPLVGRPVMRLRRKGRQVARVSKYFQIPVRFCGVFDVTLRNVTGNPKLENPNEGGEATEIQLVGNTRS